MYPIMAIGLRLPFICLSNILKGYFFGNQKMFPHVLSVVIEQLIIICLIKEILWISSFSKPLPVVPVSFE